MSGSYKSVTKTYTIADALSEAYGEFQQLRDDMQEICDNMSGANMEHLPKYEATEECKDTLENFCDEEPTVEEAIGALTIEACQQEIKRKGRAPSRQVRNDNACELMRAVKEHLEGLEDKDKVPDADYQGLIDELDNHISEAEGISYPGMYG